MKKNDSNKIDLKTPIAQVTENERIEKINPKTGEIVYQTDKLSGLYSFTEKGWISLPITNNLLNNLLICSKVTTVETVSDLSSIYDTCSTNVTTAIVLGYHKKDDGGGGIFVFDATLMPSDNDNGLIFDGWRRSVVDSSINVKWFGAKGDGVGESDISDTNLILNNTTAFKNALKELRRRTRQDDSVVSNQVSKSGIFIPSGEYIIGEDALFADDSNPIFNFRLLGINYFSDGNAILSLTNRGNTYAFKNLDRGLVISFRDITFIGNYVDTNVFYSKSSEGAQDYYFERCYFNGNFNNIFNLKGNQTNSEWGFMKCTFAGIVNTILNITGTNISDQFLNYWFDQTKFWIADGTIINADKGGHFKFVNCDWSGYSPQNENYYFKLNASVSGRGVNDFRIINGRFEMKTKHARVLKSNWQHGNIQINADFGSQTYQPFFKDNDFDVKHFEFNLQGASNVSFNSLNVNFKNSVMMGYHEINYGNNAWRGTGKILYENCAFPYRNSLDNFIQINHGTNNNKAGSAIIEIRDAIFENNPGNNSPSDSYGLEISNVNYLPSWSNSGLKKKYFKIAHAATGANPRTNQQFILNFPEEAESIITKVKWYLPKNRLTSSRVINFVLTDVNENILKSVNNNNIQTGLVRMSNGFNIEQEVYINVKNLPQGKIVLKDTSNQSNQSTNEFLCIIEYY